MELPFVCVLNSRNEGKTEIRAYVMGMLVIIDKGKIIANALRKVLELFGYEVCTVIEEIYEIIFEQKINR